MPDPSSAASDSIWAYVSPEEVRMPEPPVEEQIYTGLSVLRESAARVRNQVSRWVAPERAREPAEPSSTSASTVSLSDALRDRIVPAPDWSGAVAALGEALAPWLDGPAAPALVHEPAYHRAPVIAEKWAETVGWTVLEPPERGQLAAHEGATWASDQGAGEGPWVLPRLERWMLRTPDGLAFVRSLLDAWADGALGRGLVAVDRSTWDYLRRAWPGEIAFRRTLQPLSADALAQWLRELAGRGGWAGTAIRDRAGDVVLELNNGPSEAEGTSDEGRFVPSDFLRSLAAYSGGRPGVAWALWRQSLRRPGSETETEEAEAAPVAVEVPPWTEVDRPERPEDIERTDFLVLHAVLLHDGLSRETLGTLLPGSQSEIGGRLRRLRRAGFVVQEAEAWGLSPTGYTAACTVLQEEAYLSNR